MTSRTATPRDIWRRLCVTGIAGGGLAALLFTGVAVPSAGAQPTDPTVDAQAPAQQAEGPKKPCTGDDCDRDEADAPKVNADKVLSAIYEEYRQGDGGGQISTLIDDAMNLRRQGFRPSNGNAAALVDALDHRPNQTPLVEALKETIAYQRKLQARAAQAAADKPIAGAVPVIPGMTMPAG